MDKLNPMSPPATQIHTQNYKQNTESVRVMLLGLEILTKVFQGVEDTNRMVGEKLFDGPRGGGDRQKRDGV